MHYQVSFTLDPDIAEADAESHTIEIAPGIVNLVYITGLVGSAGLPRVRIFWGEKQLYPSSPDEWYHVDEDPITFQDWLMIADFPYELTVKAYNLDEAYEHEVIVQVNIFPLSIIAPTVTLPEIVPSPWP